MLMETESLKVLFDRADTNFEELMQAFSQSEEKLYSLIPRESFVSLTSVDLRKTDYAIMSIDREMPLRSISESALSTENPVRQKYIWIRLFCQDPEDCSNFQFPSII